MTKRIDLTGKTYGRLTVLEYIGNAKYKCKCECGKITIANTENLKRGHTKSCGCLKINDLTGQRFGKLVVLEPDSAHKTRSARRYLCQCDCGNLTKVYGDALQSGGTKSCGCLAQAKTQPPKMRETYIVGTQICKLDGRKTKANKSGAVGVCWDKSRDMWYANIRFRGKQYNLGRFKDFDDAVKARETAEQKVRKQIAKEIEAEGKKTKG